MSNFAASPKLADNKVAWKKFWENQRQRAPWLEYAYREIGTTEIKGKESNPRIVEYLQTCGFSLVINPKTNLSSDETNWCSAFVNWCMENAGYPGTKSTLAKSWLYWPLGQKIEEPVLGCIAVFEEHSSTGGSTGADGDAEKQIWSKTRGHVAFFWEKKGGVNYYLGGNQGNTVKISPVKNKLVGYIIPRRVINSNGTASA